MNCPKRPETRLHHALAKAFPELLGVGRHDVRPEDHAPNTEYRIEPSLEYDPDAQADLVVKNALLDNGRTVDIAVKGNVITRVGDSAEVATVTGADTRVLNARGNSVSPGFVDSHLHLAVAMQRLGSLDVEDVNTAEEFNRRLAEFAANNPDTPALHVYGVHYLDDPIIPAETCRQTLDTIVADRPVLVFAHDLHTAWGNTRAVEEAGLLHKMPPYPHLVEKLHLEEKIVTDAEGVPTGEFREPEVYYFLCGPLQAKYPRSVEQQLDDLESVCNQLAGMGITGVHRMALAQPAEDLSFLLLLLELEQRGRLPIRVNASFSSIADHNMLHDVVMGYEARELLTRARKQEITAAQLHDALVELLRSAGSHRHKKLETLAAKDGGEKHPRLDKLLQTSEHILDTVFKSHVAPHHHRRNPHHAEDMPRHLGYHAKVRLDTLKIFMDGVIEKDTAYRLDKAPTPGIPEFTQEELDTLVMFADKLGIQVAAHCIGNGSVKSMLDAIAKARQANRDVDGKRGHMIHHRIEHIETCTPEDLPRFGSEGVITSMQPLHERPPMTMWHTLVSEPQWNTAFAWQGALDAGAVLVFGSDWPIVSCDVRTGIHHAVTRKPWVEGGENQAVTLPEAVAAYTSGAAFSGYSQNIKGAIEPGMLADMVVLSGNIAELEKDPSGLDVAATICDGAVVYER